MGVSGTFAALKGAVMPGNSNYRYSAIPAPTPSQACRTGRHVDGRARLTRLLKLSAGGMALFALLAVAAVYVHGQGSASRPGACERSGQCTGISSHTWGQYSPFFSAPSAIDASTPAGCELTFALVLSRHGSRFPTSSKAAAYRSLVARIQASVTRYGAGYEFIKDYAFDLGADRLTAFGEQEMVDSGAAFFRRYEKLAEGSDPFIRASGSGRVVMSAQNFTRGFYAAQGKSGADQLAKMLVVPESAGFNNTLDHGGCPAFEHGPGSDLGQHKQEAWRATWATPIMERLNAKLPGANLTLQETVFVMDLCPFNTVATPDAATSDFCRLFSSDEWRGYDYFGSLEKWYSYGRGNPLGPTQGAGYANELIARLTGKAVEDHTSTNSTLDSSPQTFPLDRRLYADFGHDNSMTSAYAALGLYNETADLPVTHRLSPHQTHGYSASWTVPFAGRMYVEKMRCVGGEEELVRILVNERVVSLSGCGADELGRCKLGDLVASLSFVRAGGRWDSCFT
ncbi:3-phytase A [Tolypocladium ophioglossoides CBS 100239]|uniref:Phytase A n=1 Tax=Tolypocladium ophioglossoides (strain CBS 100239) TaxID=1163406 RepID=A0A0L0N893_TOLOC|nr:3-phytase A [Tolypocladium ophioglossoides CBS 100239]